MEKTSLLIFLFLALSTSLLSAEENQIFTGLKGSYAIYEDDRYENPAYISVCFVGNDSIIMRIFEPDTGNDTAIKAKFNNIDGVIDYDPDMVLIKGALDSSDTVKRLFAQILNWANTWFSLKGKVGVETKYNGESGYTFSFWIPVFQLSSIGNGLNLITTGMAKNENDPVFLDFKGLPRASYTPSYSIKETDSLAAEIDGISIPLDKNWNKAGESEYRISQFSDEDAIFKVNTSRPADSGINSTAKLVTLHMIAEDGTRLLVDGSKVFIVDGIFNLVKRSYDEATGRVYIKQMQFLPRGNGFVSVVELSVLETIYNKNKAYFNAILY